MITRSLSRLRRRGGERRSPGRGRGTRAILPRASGTGRPGPMRRIGNKRRGMTAANNYWPATTNANNPNNAWNVNFNNGNVNNNNKNNDNYVRAVRSGS